MSKKRYFSGILLTLVIFFSSFDVAYAANVVMFGGCGWNPFCHAAKFLIGDPLSAAMPELPELKAKVTLSHKIENVDELQALVRTTGYSAERVLHVTGGETRATIEKARVELAKYTVLLDSLAGKRIADLDARLQAKLLWIQQYTEQLSTEIQEIIKVTSQELQAVIGVTSTEAQNIINTSGSVAQETIRVSSDELQEVIGTGGQVMQNTIRLSGEELRFSVLTASGEIKDIVTQASIETQNAIRTASDEIDEIVENTIQGIDQLLHTAEGSSLRVLESGLYIVERGADLTLTLGSTAAGLIFLFIAAYGWGRAILREKMPPPGLTRKLVVAFMIATFCAALLPFSFLSKEVRAYALLPFDKTGVYARVVGESREQFLGNLSITSIEPEKVTVWSNGQTQTEELVITGFGLLNHGYPEVTFGQYELAATGIESSLSIDLGPVNADPQAAKFIEVRFDGSEGGLRQVEVEYRDAPPTPKATVLPTQVPTDTPVPFASIIVNRQANVRSGPGFYPVIGGAEQGKSFYVTGKSSGVDWLQIEYQNQQGWIYGGLVSFTDTAPIPDIASPEFLPFPTPTPLPVPTACVMPSTSHFTASSSTIRLGEETVLGWGDVQNAESVGIEGEGRADGVNFSGELKVSPEQTTTYQLTALYCGGQKTILGEVRVEVERARISGICDQIRGHLEYGEQVRGQVQNADCWTFDGGADQWVEVNMSSSDMDTYLELYDPTGVLLLSNDDYDDTRHSRIYIDSLPRTGRYTIVAKGYSGARGSYRLALR